MIPIFIISLLSTTVIDSLRRLLGKEQYKAVQQLINQKIDQLGAQNVDNILYFLRGFANVKLENFEQGISDLSQFLSKEKNVVQKDLLDSYELLCTSNLKTGKINEALKYADTLLKSFKGSFKGNENYLMSLYNTFQEAVKKYSSESPTPSNQNSKNELNKYLNMFNQAIRSINNVNAKEILNTAKEEVINAGKQAFNTAKEEVKNTGQQIYNAAKAEAKNAEQQINEAKEEAKNAEQKINEAKEEVKNAGQQIYNAAKEDAKNAKQQINEAKEEVKDAGQQLYNAAKEEAKNAKQQINEAKEEVKDAGQQLYNAAKEDAKNAEQKINEAKEEVKDAGQQLYNAAKEDAKNAGNNLNDAYQNAFNNL